MRSSAVSATREYDLWWKVDYWTRNWNDSLGRFHVFTITPPAVDSAVSGLTLVRDAGHPSENALQAAPRDFLWGGKWVE